MPIIETEQQTNQNVISGQEYLDAGATKELVGQLRGYAEGYNDGYDAGAAAGSGGSGGGGSATAYAWAPSLLYKEYFPFSVAPATKSEFEQFDVIYVDDNGRIVKTKHSITEYTKVSDTEFSITFSDETTSTYTRDTTQDITLW